MILNKNSWLKLASHKEKSREDAKALAKFVKKFIECFIGRVIDLQFVSDGIAWIWFYFRKERIDVSRFRHPIILYIDKFTEYGADNTAGILKAYKTKGSAVTFDANVAVYRVFRCRRLWNKMLLSLSCYVRPDLIHIGKVYAVDPKTLAKIRKETGAFAVFFYGDFLLKHELTGARAWIVNMGRSADALLIMQKDEGVLNEFKRLGVDPGFWWSGIDPEIFYPRKTEKEYEVSFFSQNLYRRRGREERRELIRALTQERINVHLFGANWDRWAYLKETQYAHVHPFVSSHELAEAISKSKITITYNSYAEHNTYMACAWRRVNSCMACGSLHMIKYFPGLEEVFVDRKHVVYFYDIPQAVELVRYYLQYDDEREKIGNQGRIETLNKHTWDHRIEEVFRIYENTRIGMGVSSSR